MIDFRTAEVPPSGHLLAVWTVRFPWTYVYDASPEIVKWRFVVLNCLTSKLRNHFVLRN